jgi:hypothetical protein
MLIGLIIAGRRAVNGQFLSIALQHGALKCGYRFFADEHAVTRSVAECPAVPDPIPKPLRAQS